MIYMGKPEAHEPIEPVHQPVSSYDEIIKQIDELPLNKNKEEPCQF